MFSDDLINDELMRENYGHPVLSSDDNLEVKKLLTIKHNKDLADRRFEVFAGLNKEILTVEVLLANADQSFYYPVQSRMEFDPKRSSKKDAALFLIDYIDQYFSEFFQDQALLPIDWQDYDYQGVALQLKGQIHNRAVDALADQLLRGTPISH